jgi:hypothetical protein
MADIGDFLYSTMDVAIWSTVEPGIGITASAAATLRPLFRVYFSGTLGTGSGTKPSASNCQPKFNRRASGYTRSRDTETFALRSDVGKSGGVTTMIEGDVGMVTGTSGGLHDGNIGGWNDSESKLRGGSSDLEERSWGTGIMKTTGTTQVTN